MLLQLNIKLNDKYTSNSNAAQEQTITTSCTVSNISEVSITTMMAYNVLSSLPGLVSAMVVFQLFFFQTASPFQPCLFI